MRRRRDLYLVAMVALLAVAAGGMVEVFWIDSGIVVDSIAYRDGGAVDITLDGNWFRFVAVKSDGRVESVSQLMPCVGDLGMVVVRANGRYVHLVVEDICGVHHLRYELPEGMVGLKQQYYSLLPLIGGEGDE